MVLSAVDPAPTWKFSEPPWSRLMPLKFVFVAMRSSSLPRSSASVLIAARELVLFESLAPWTARSRMRCRIEVTSLSAPSAVWMTEMPSCALRPAWAMPEICDCRPSEIDRPAASSAALLMR